MARPRIRTSFGELLGVDAGGVASFKGIPFAAPPTGARRWRAPELPETWRGVREAQTFGNSAMQSSLGPMGDLIGIAAGPISEDCLYLNVWTPACDDRARPVLVWIHGGGNVVGSGSQPRVNGETLARRGDVVVVTVNYRLGVFGFLMRPSSAPLVTKRCSIR
jgi:para-nitrobenzyl esterase